MLTLKGTYANQGENRKRKRRVDIVDTRNYEGSQIDPYEAPHIRQIKIITNVRDYTLYKLFRAFGHQE